MMWKHPYCIFFLLLGIYFAEAFAFTGGCKVPPSMVRQSSRSRSNWIALDLITSVPRPTCLRSDLWGRMGLEADEVPQWYLLNCIAGLEEELLEQCRIICKDDPDAIRFVVPTEYNTRSHGAGRIITERRVKFPGYVFAKLRLGSELYDKLRSLELMRTFTGTKRGRRLPPKPSALDDLEIERFGLEDTSDEISEEEDLNPVTNSETSGEELLIVDAEDSDSATSKMDKITEENLKVYNGLRVDDKVKVTKQSAFLGEDGIIRRLKDGKIFVRFQTYGTMFEKWLEPGDVRKLTNAELLQGLSGPTRPITQADFDGPSEEPQRLGQDNFDRRLRQPNSFGGSPQLRNRRQDRIAADFRQRDSVGRSEQDKEREEKIWKLYKDQQQRQGDNGAAFFDDGSGRRFRSESRSSGDDDEAEWAVGDADSQWGRKPQRQQRRERKQIKERLTGASDNEWGSLVPPKRDTRPSSDSTPNDFFESLVAGLSTGNDSSHKQRGFQQDDLAKAAEDDFFASLVTDFADVSSDRIDTKPRENRRNVEQKDSSKATEDDFFAYLAADISEANSDRSDQRKPSRDMAKKAQTSSPDDDFFASLEQQLSEIGNDSYDSNGNSDNLDDLFASLASDGPEVDRNEEKVPTPGGGMQLDSPQAMPETLKFSATPATSSAVSSSKSKDLTGMTVQELKEKLRERKLKVSGTKAELIERLSSVRTDG